MEIIWNIFSAFDLLKVDSIIKDFYFYNSDASAINN